MAVEGAVEHVVLGALGADTLDGLKGIVTHVYGAHLRVAFEEVGQEDQNREDQADSGTGEGQLGCERGGLQTEHHEHKHRTGQAENEQKIG